MQLAPSFSPHLLSSDIYLNLFVSSLLILLFRKGGCFNMFFFFWLLMSPVRDRVRTKMERDILVEVNHPFIVKLHYGESQTTPQPIRSHDSSFSSRPHRANICRSSVSSNLPPSFSVPDGGEGLPDPGLPQRRRSLHASLQGGNVTSLTVRGLKICLTKFQRRVSECSFPSSGQK